MFKPYITFFKLFICIYAGISLSLLSWPDSVRAGDKEEKLMLEILQQLNEVNARFISIEKRLDTIENGQSQQGTVEKPQVKRTKEQDIPANRQEVNYLREDVDEIFERLDVTEKKTLMDRVNLGVALRTRVDNMYWQDNQAGIATHNDNFWSSRFRLRMGAALSDQLKFTGRMSVYKNWADVDYSPMIWEANFSERPTNTTVRLDRAYVDLIFSDFFIPVSFTVGRQPTVGGIPGYFKDDTASRSTYPSLPYEKETDGICMTLGLSKWTGWKNSALRVMYGKFLQPDNDRFLFLDDKGEDMDMLWLQAETRFSGNFKNTSSFLTYVRNWNMSGAPAEPVTSQPGNLGYNENYAFTLVAENIFDLGLDGFLSYGLSKAYSSGNTIMADFNGDGTPETYGLLSNDGVGDHSGDAFFVGIKYHLPFEFLNGAKIGIEYNQGSKYWWSPTLGSDDLFNKLGTRGNAWEIYYIQPFLKHALIRIGMIDINYDYYSLLGGPIGEPGDVDQQLQAVYMLLDINF